MEEMRKRLSIEEAGGSEGEVARLRSELSALEKRRENEVETLKKRLQETERSREEEVAALKKRVAELEKTRDMGDSKSLLAPALSTEEKLRRAVVAELIKTEKDYLEDLILLRGVVFENLKSLDPALTGEELAKIIAASSKLLEGLQKDATHGDAIPMLINDLISNSLTAYSEYCSGSFNAATAMMLKNSKSFVSLRKKVEADPSMKGLPLEAQLIKPVQRICRYPLLLSELKRRTKEG